MSKVPPATVSGAAGKVVAELILMVPSLTRYKPVVIFVPLSSNDPESHFVSVAVVAVAPKAPEIVTGPVPPTPRFTRFAIVTVPAKVITPDP
jgi:hypothetical protein